jgi:hypothetical protein
MKKNIGSFDRNIRLLVAIVLLIIALIGVVPGNWNIITWSLGGIFLLTSLTGRCPLYSACGIDTQSHDKAQSSKN